MSLHLGNDFSISLRHIVCIMRLDHDQKPFTRKGPQSRTEKARKIGSPPYHSAIMGMKGTLFLTPFTVRTLVGRIQKNSMLLKRMESANGKRT